MLVLLPTPPPPARRSWPVPVAVVACGAGVPQPVPQAVVMADELLLLRWLLLLGQGGPPGVEVRRGQAMWWKHLGHHGRPHLHQAPTLLKAQG